MKDLSTDLQLVNEVATAVLSQREAREPALALAQGHTPTQLGSVAEATAHQDAAFFASCLARLAEVDAAKLAAAPAAFLRALRIDLANRVAAVQFQHLEFVVTPYRGGDLHADARAAFEAHPIDRAEERQAFIALVQDYARLLLEIHSQTSMQLARGLRLAAPAVELARVTLSKLNGDLASAITPDAARLRHIGTAERGRFVATIARLIERELVPPMQQLVMMLDDSYAASAPEGVGLSQYARGEEYYRFLIRQRADSEHTAETIQKLGLQEIERLSATRIRLRQELAPHMPEREFDHMLQTDARWRMRTPADVEARFSSHMKRIEPEMPRWFARLPKAPWAVTRADPAAEAGMSYGYYRRPTRADPVGRYFYNGSNLERRSLIGAAHLIYHELLPGHHLQLALQGEESVVHPLQSHLNSMASAEGWAVYASELACEMGLIKDFDLYGHCLMQGLLATRLVVDTGLNALGWTLDRARAFMKQHTSESELVIDHELLRYSTDIPAQALAYSLGARDIMAMREQARTQLARGFDVRAFHGVVLGVGGYPLPVIGERLRDFVRDFDAAKAARS